MYPAYSSTSTDAVLSAAVSLSLPLQEQQKLSSCRPHHYCNSTFCPHCLKRAGFQRQTRLLQVASNVPHPLKFGTFTGRNLPMGRVREASTVLMQTARTVCKRFKVKGFALRLEVSDPKGLDLHPHVHGLIDTPSGGRGYVSPSDWQDAWLHALPQDLHPTVGGAHIKPVRNLGASCNYLLKSAFSALCEDAYDGDDIERVVAYITACKGTQQFSVRGSLAA